MRGRKARLLLLGVVAVLAGVLALSATVGAHRSGGRHQGNLKANLLGANEVPGPGDTDGRGNALVAVLPRFDAVCFRLRWRDIADPTGAHIHKAAKGVPGPIVVRFFDGTADDRGCINGLTDDELLRDIKRNPHDYYVNIHNADFPNGAIRGQLKRTGRHRGQLRRR